MNKCALLLGLLASPAFALEVTFLDVSYTTTINAGPLAATQTAATPISNELVPGPLTYARASADTFAVSTATSAFLTSDNIIPNRAGAIATTALRFSPIVDGLASMAFDITGTGMAIYSDGFMSLHDLTTDTSMFHYSWVGFRTNVPGFGPTAPLFGNSFNISDLLLDSHDYLLTLHAHTHANSDQQGVGIRVAGFTPAVPEPETYAMMLLGLGMVGYSVKRHAMAKA